MPQITLEKIADVTKGVLTGDGDQVIEFLETDSRNINPGDEKIFIAIKGPRHDGHVFIPELIKTGVKNFLAEETDVLENAGNKVNYIRVKSSIAALQQLAGWYRESLHMPVVAITGSNGKTVVKEWLSQCLSNYAVVTRSPKSYNSQIGVPLSLWMLNPRADWSVIEAGISMPGEMARLRTIIAPDLGIFTNIGPAHQENFSGLEEKIREKLQLFSHAQTLYYCRDHELVHQMIMEENLLCKKVSWSVKHKDAYLQVKNIRKRAEFTEIEMERGKNKNSLSIPFTDDASIENCLHIACFMLHQKFTIDQTQNALSRLKPVGMRLELVKGINNSTLINDSYNSDIFSLKIALDFLSMQKKHSKHALILSDIRQSGKSHEELYSEVVRLISSYSIDRFVAIGPEITRYEGLPENTLCFNDTSGLLNELPEIDFSDHAILIKGAREFGFEQVVAALSEKKHTTLLEINLNNLISNLNYFRGLLSPETGIMVMVKALTYGSGGNEIASLLQHEKVDYLGVAFTDEGVELRKSGITLPVMVMAPTAENYDKIIEHKLEPEIFSFSGLYAFSEMLAHNQIPEYPVHIKIDTGMHRLGFLPDEIETLADELIRLKSIHVKAIFSHLAVSDNPEEDGFTCEQIEKFTKIYDYLSGKLNYKPIRHILNSAGIERFPQAHFDLVRLGIGLHGISSVEKHLQPVSTLKTCITQIKKIPVTDTVGYNRHGILTRDSEIAIIPIGYADGLSRKLGNGNGLVVIHDQKVPFVGDICMDLSMVDVTGLKAKEGDEVIIFGKQNPIETLARQVGTIPYEILTSVSTRVKRIYINE